MKRRAAAVGVMAIGLTVTGLLGGGSSVVPFTGKPVATVPTDRFAVASANDFNSNDNVVAMGPNHSLYSYWQIGGTWYGPLGIAGPGTAYSGPAIAAENNLDVAVEGPNHTLFFFWQISGTWYGPLQIGAPGSTFSRPAIRFDDANNVDVTAQGPNGSTYFYWGISGAWKGPLGIAGPGTSFSAPSIGSTTCGSGGTHNCVDVSVKGPANQSLNYFAMDGNWTAPSTSGQNQEYSAPSYTSVFTMGGYTQSYQGPNNSVIFQESTQTGGTNIYCVAGGPGTAYSAPGMFAASTTGTGSGFTSFSENIGVMGPSNSLYAFWTQFDSVSNCPSFYGPLQLSGNGTTFSVPSVLTVFDTNLITDMFIEGPSHTLYEFWSDNGSWYGPLQVGGIGSTFDSSS